MTRPHHDPPASYYEELMDTPDPRGVEITRNAAGAVTDCRLDPQEFDGPNGVPEQWEARRPTPRGLWVSGSIALWAGFLAYLLYLVGVLIPRAAPSS